MIVGQDWGSHRSYERQLGLDLASNATNRRLRELLALVGVEVPDVADQPASSGAFLTNAILCLKGGGSQSAVATEWFANCGTSFLKPQIELVRPRVVVTLGQRAYEALMNAFGLPRRKFREAVESPGVSLASDVTAVAVYHCGRSVRNKHRRDAEQERDWRRVRWALESGSGAWGA